MKNNGLDLAEPNFQPISVAYASRMSREISESSVWVPVSSRVAGPRYACCVGVSSVCTTLCSVPVCSHQMVIFIALPV